ncbi:MAG TPA: TetR/AcrR family transcriptional regulator [Usitatibacter sp.]|jgi:AcrR family transcriptional regulator|nr:TetR/AcrR family transcriptional regulator [Usitatibacter sp.]
MKSSRGGRPSLEESERLADRILAAATKLFLAEGYGATSIERVARAAGVSKRTFYSRFPDKAALFAAVLERIVEGLRPRTGVVLAEEEDLESILRRLAGLILHAALEPQAIAVHRLIIGESARFPALAAAVNRNAANEEAVALIANLLEREMRMGRISVDDPRFAARHFLHMVMTIPVRAAMGLQVPMSNAELREWPAKVVSLFLSGCSTGAEGRRTRGKAGAS